MTLYTLAKHARRRCSIVVTFNDELAFAGVYVESNKILDEMTEWCIASESGTRTSWNIFQFKTLKEMNMFILRWK